MTLQRKKKSMYEAVAELKVKISVWRNTVQEITNRTFKKIARMNSLR
jgi:hypothetical protein